MNRYEFQTYAGKSKMHPCEKGDWVPHEDAAELQRQLDEVTRERDHLRLALRVADALRNHEHETTLKRERRQWRRT